MKKLYKRISAILLAGAIIFGGAFSNGLSVHADYAKESISELSESDQVSYKDVLKICKELKIRVRGVSNDRSIMNEFIKDVFPKNRRLRNRLLEMNINVMSKDALKIYLASEKSKGVKFLRLEIMGLEYLFFL